MDRDNTGQKRWYYCSPLCSPAQMGRELARADGVDGPEQLYTVNEIAEQLKLSPNQVRKVFGSEPGVIDLSEPQYFGRRRRILRIPASVLKRVVIRSTISPKSSAPRLQVASANRGKSDCSAS